jgi:hypothetical protein
MIGPPSRLSSTIRFAPQAGKKATFQFIKNFRPEDIGNITLWLDAAETSTFSFISGSQVFTWADKKIPQYLFGITEGGSRPLYNATGFNGRPTVTFAAGNGLLSSSTYTLTTTNAVTIFLVGQLTPAPPPPPPGSPPPIGPPPPPPPQQAMMFRAGDARGEYLLLLDVGTDSTIGYDWYGRGDITEIGNSAGLNTVFATVPTVVCLTVPAGQELNQQLFLNASPDNGPFFAQSIGTRASAQTLNGVWDVIFLGTNGVPGGGALPWIGSISEVIVYEDVLEVSNIQKVAGYLGQKWGFQGSLSTPYNEEQVFKPVTTGASVFYKNEML